MQASIDYQRAPQSYFYRLFSAAHEFMFIVLVPAIRHSQNKQEHVHWSVSTSFWTSVEIWYISVLVSRYIQWCFHCSSVGLLSSVFPFSSQFCFCQESSGKHAANSLWTRRQEADRAAFTPRTPPPPLRPQTVAWFSHRPRSEHLTGIYEVMGNEVAAMLKIHNCGPVGNITPRI